MTTLDERLDMGKGVRILTQDGERLRDMALGELSKSIRDSQNQLWQIVFKPQGLSEETVGKICKNNSVRPGKLVQFFDCLGRSLDKDLRFDEDKHSEEPKEAFPKAARKPIALIPNQAEMARITASYLLIKVWKAKATDSGYCIEAAIASSKTPLGEDTWLTESKVSLNWDNELVENFPKRLDDLLNEVSRDIPIDKLTVQWFLPIELMSLPIEHWEIAWGRGSNFHCRVCQSVEIRSYDRYQMTFRKSLGKLKDKWRRLNQQELLPRYQELPELNEFQDSCSLGTRFILPEQKIDDFWDNMLMAGFPVALWIRQPHSEEAKTILESLMDDRSIADLPKDLGDLRRYAAAGWSGITIEERRGVGQLALMWDNPFRPFPETSYLES
jgi:hypothetical protein